jgi:hypothetical protein
MVARVALDGVAKRLFQWHGPHAVGPSEEQPMSGQYQQRNVSLIFQVLSSGPP